MKLCLSCGRASCERLSASITPAVLFWMSTYSRVSSCEQRQASSYIPELQISAHHHKRYCCLELLGQSEGTARPPLVCCRPAMPLPAVGERARRHYTALELVLQAQETLVPPHSPRELQCTGGTHLGVFSAGPSHGYRLSCWRANTWRQHRFLEHFPIPNGSIAQLFENPLRTLISERDEGQPLPSPVP